jgi:FAD/FMN-containing dehydrogenase
MLRPGGNFGDYLIYRGARALCDRLGLSPPFPTRHRAYVLVEAAGRADPTDALASCVDAIATVAAVAVAPDPERAHALWRYREGHTEAINGLGPPHKLDVTLPADALGAFVAAVAERVRAVAPDAQVWLFGHAGDGNVHVNVTGVAPDDEQITDCVLRLVVEMHGSISAEHGIGTAKRQWLHLVRSPAEIAAYRAIKRALDPAGLFNRRVLLPDDL